MFSWTKVLVLVALSLVMFESVALAQKAVTVHVIALDSDDASEDQADALTAALRARVRNAPTLQLADSNQSLATLLPALKCPTRPDSACLQRIGDQLKTDRFFWGTVVKGTVAHQVVAEAHLWTRGKPEQVARETYSDNLKDQNDDALKRIATQLFEHLTGQTTQGSLAVHVNGAQVGTVIVDGKPAGQIAGGQATLQVTSGMHTVDVQAEGMTTTPQNVSIVVNAQADVTFEMKAVVVPPVQPSSPSHAKRTIGYVTLGLAAASAIGAAVMGGLYASNAGTFNGYRNFVDVTNQHICTNPGALTSFKANGTTWSDACSARDAAGTDGSIAWALGGAAVGLATIGVILVMTDHSDKEAGSPSPPAARLRVIPSFGPTGGSVTALVTF